MDARSESAPRTPRVGDGRASLARDVAGRLTGRLDGIAASLAQESEALYPTVAREERTRIARTQAQAIIRCMQEQRLLTDFELSSLAVPEFPTGSATFQAQRSVGNAVRVVWRAGI